MAPKLYSLALLCCPPAAGAGKGRLDVNARQESPEKKLTNFRMNISLIFLKGDRSRHKEQDDDYDCEGPGLGLSLALGLGLVPCFGHVDIVCC